MKRALFSLFRQDLVLSWRNGLVLVTIITLAVVIALYWALPFMVPEDTAFGTSQVFLDETEDQILTRILKGNAKTAWASDREDMESRVREKNGTTGIIAEGSAEDITYTLVFKSSPSGETLAIAKAVLRTLTAQAMGQPYGPPAEIELLREGVEKIGLNQSMIVILLTFEVIVLGFLFVAVVVFSEKKEGSIRAYRVAPSGLGNYVFSKGLLFTLLCTLYGIIMTAATVGFSVDYLALTAVLLLSCGLMTLLGLGIAAFFNNISEWFISGVLVLAVNMLSLLPFQIPTLSVRFLTILPGYTMIFGIREILFPTGKEGFLTTVFLILGIEFALFAGFALWSVRRNMLKET